MPTFDLIVIGAGPGGYVAAIRAAQLGLNTACVEKRGALGGTCLNIGCIPSKALLESSKLFEEANHTFAAHGIKAKVDLDLKTMMGRKAKVVEDLTKGVEGLFKKNKVTYLKGSAAFKDPTTIEVAGPDGAKETYTAKNFIIATGSDVMPLPGVTIDEKRIVSSTGALSLEGVPKHLIVVGGGVIGLELGSVWRRLGSKVTVVEYLDRILPGMDTEIARQFQRILEKQGMTFKLSTKVTAAENKGKTVKVALESAQGGNTETLEADAVLVAIGRRPYTEGLNLAATGIALDAKGRIPTDAHLRTSVPGIYAIGDAVAGPMLAHKAEDEGVMVAEILAGQAGHVNYETIPGVIYTWPEVATVGKTEEELRAAGTAFTIGKFPFMANSRGRAVGQTDGFVKILADAKTDRVYGVHIIGPEAGNMIHEAVLAMEFGASSEDIARTCHAHPTLNEAVKEAALAVAGRAIHI